MMKSSVSKQITKFGNDASRRLYRAGVDAARKLEQHLSIASSLTELFSMEVTDLRMRLKDYCERLIFTDPVEYGKKAEDLLWRKVYYDFFFKCKQHRKKFMESEIHRSALLSHLLAGIGFYHHLLLRIQTEFHVNLEGKVDVPLLWHVKGVKKERWKKYQQSAATDESVQSWADSASHRILIYLGDLERYIAELDEPESNHLAERYYQQAFCLNSQNGTPHNQLGSLYNNRFDSAYHYMRCLTCQDKFDGADANLHRVFEKNEEVIEQLYSPECIEKESLKCSRFLSRFLKLCQIFYFKPCENYSSELYCQDILKEFDITDNCESYDNGSSTEDVHAFLSDDIIFKVVVMSLMCVRKLQEKGHSDASVATAFCLALFSYVVQKANRRLISSILALKPIDAQKYNCISENAKNLSKLPVVSKEKLFDVNEESETNEDHHSNKPSRKKNGLKKVSARHLRTLRRRRKMSSTSQEDSELSEGEMTDLPESDEESALLNSDVSETGSISSESLSENELLVEENGFNEGESNMKSIDSYIVQNGTPDSNKNSVGKEVKFKNNCEKNTNMDIDSVLDEISETPEKLVQILKKNTLLPCLKILTDWLRINEDILSACAESSQYLLTCLIQLLNILLRIEEKLLTSKEHLQKFKYVGTTWAQTYPLPEDTLLQSFPLLKEIHSSIQFDIFKRRELPSSAQVYFRVQCLLSFGKCLIKASESSVDFDVEKKKYFFNLCNKAKESIKEDTVSVKPVNHKSDNQKQYLMRSMAHLWLKAEVNNLETQIEGGSGPQLSPYIVADTSVLCSNLPSLKQLLSAKRFIVVVPLVVIASLDHLKKESIGAREAIRWLEAELRKGSRYIRAQRQVEKNSLVPMKYPRKKDKDAWDFFQVLECCNYLVQLQTNGKTDCHLVTLLVGSLHHLPDNAVAIAQSIDVMVETLSTFLSKWRTSSKNPG
ncbi:hypothetical protein JTE90_014077 [Oedothorax gibbosus]|uniref:Protein SMG5 n=1 Tax=Oedothorax gibbosus TaxID=931172 RepID=A0AAV6TWH7_9ARAC|nr:hypothetical protein JTE90_014077 [Oedothorax gibbosus]